MVSSFRIAVCALGFCLATGQAQTVLRIAAGGPGGLDTARNTWAPDADYSGGSMLANCGPCPAGVSVPFLTSRSNRPGATNPNLRTNFLYTIPVAPGLYTVTLGFIEPSATAPGQRLFNVTANGQTALSRFDIFQSAGGALTPITRAFPVLATGPQITLQFTAVTGLALVSNIQTDALITASGGLPPGPAGPAGAAGSPGAPGSQGPPGPMIPIQYDSYVVNCSAQPPSNCNQGFNLTYMPVGRIGVFDQGLLVQPQCYTVGFGPGVNTASVTFLCPVTSGDTITLVYPAAGPAAAIGAPQ